MKNVLVIILLLSHIFGYSQLEISYNQITNTVSVAYNGCDICLLGNQHAVNICECRQECERPGTGFKDCLKACSKKENPLSSLECIENCEKIYLEPYEECLDSCGVEPVPTRKIIAFTYILVAGWDVIPLDPRKNKDQWVTFNSGMIENGFVTIPDWNPPDPWPAISNGNNTCYGIAIRIAYQDQDGNVGYCDFYKWICNFIG